MAQTIPDRAAIQVPPQAGVAASGWTWAALLLSLVALAGSLWLSIGMKLKACPFCFYQRTFVMSVVAVLVIGLLTGQRHRAVLNRLALPLVVAALGVAGFHVYLEVTGKLECPAGVLGLGTAPQQSLAALSRQVGEQHLAAVGAGVVLGLLLAWAAVASSPPMPPAPTQAYTTPLDICRPPFHPQ